MLLTEQYRPPVSFPQQQPRQPQNLLQPRSRPNNSNNNSNNNHQFYDSAQQTSAFATSDNDLDLEANSAIHSLSSSPLSTQSILSQYSNIQHAPFSGFDGIPTIAVPREAQHSALFDLPADAPLFGNADLMHQDSWNPSGQLTPGPAARFSSHQRESSLSSLGSAGPASPYSHNTSNPHIAVAESVADTYHGLPTTDDFSNYQLASKGFHGQDTFYANYPNYASADAATHQAFSNNAGAMPSQSRQKNERGLLPPPDFPGSHNGRSRPVSVASSVTSDSPLTPAGEPDDSERRRKMAFPAVPKLDRTMTDIYSDELYNPNFTITSAPPTQMTVSPSNEVFAQRLQAANSHNLSVHSPVSAPSRDRSPFQHGSPLAPAPSHDFSSPMPSQRAVFGSAQQIREQRKAEQDAQAVQEQLARSASIGTPQTISPKDALLEYHAPEGEADFPLFQQQGASSFDSLQMKDAPQPPHPYEGLRLDANSFGNFAPSQLPTTMQLPQQYSFAQRSQANGRTPLSNSSMEPSRVGSTESVQSDASHVDSNVERPAATGADGGTYTCTYHGCTLRFETPALLQKHKREGHRQAHGLGAPRRPDSAGEGMTSSTIVGSQAGPHKCERINPSTGKPCNTIFSRPYDLTRHEDTIHNARKQKVRCNLCTDEKTFSRADALTRHYRVCHPEVEFPGRHRRRAGH